MAAAAEVGAGCGALAQANDVPTGDGAEDAIQDRPASTLAPVAEVVDGDRQAGFCAPSHHSMHTPWLLLRKRDVPRPPVQTQLD